MPELGLILLAAGRGTRFGAAPKLLQPLAGRPLVRHAAEAAIGSGLGPVVAVLGAHADRVGAALDGLDLVRIVNPAYAGGLATSLQAGLAALPAEVAGAIVLLGDMPRVTARHLTDLAEAFRRADPAPSAVVPIHAGRRGNPVLLNLGLLAPALAALSGDQGAGRLLAGRDDVLACAMDAGVIQDVDTPDGLAALG
ncbi:4-diphosphocytidyl-2C-methyl-D-erythritol kinase [Methylobacterium sp. Leaf104]|uniref:nucleotidyltransferase family protein n=1 Tax=Methylobacterium TaxID=407 RepID=UPI0006F4256D|nr:MULTISPECIES: nucleotidyltransferase family protein [Methylobacterium]KQP42378.1 4-diphosphocytidyl-2C-methyl-D-erythritol kinase [Methylobacterium sp. Leaf104]MCI9879104.1 nucleotidyltransferase family protein [Methylobacterium goesingense]